MKTLVGGNMYNPNRANNRVRDANNLIRKNFIHSI